MNLIELPAYYKSNAHPVNLELKIGEYLRERSVSFGREFEFGLTGHRGDNYYTEYLLQ